VDSYNCTRPHSGRYCLLVSLPNYGKTPMQTFLDSKQIVEAKMLERQYEDKMEEKTENKREYGESPPTSEARLTPFVSVR
jgi:DNA-binding HxlR family transcriptional regulator